MSPFFYYPLNDFEPAMKGMIIGGMGIFHVFVAQFAIGAGMLMCYFQWLAMTGRIPIARRFLDSYFKFLVLISFVTGALTGVGMWLTTIQISPRTIGLMVDEFHWLWATEWTFFCLEVAAGYAYYRYSMRIDDRTRLMLLFAYSLAAWFSLFWINGILAWQLTPGAWADTGRVWDGFFNPSFFPSLIFRTIVAMTIAGLAACVVINTIKDLDRRHRAVLVRKAANFLIPMALMPVLGIWYLWTIPADSREWVLGGSPAMTMFLTVSIGTSLLIGGYALVGLVRQNLYINGATATLLCALAFAATAGGEFVREGSRKPYTVRTALYANSIKPNEVMHLREVGSVSGDPYPMRDGTDYPNEQVTLGAKVFRFQCGVCHTVNGMNGLVHLTGPWTTEQKRLNIAQLQHTKPFMPPFSGTADELEALVQFVEWRHDGSPADWPISDDPAIREQIDAWIKHAGLTARPAAEVGTVLAEHGE